MAKKEDKKPVAQTVAVTPAGYDFSNDAGAGFENVRPDDLSIPFLVILQDGSPEVKKTHPDYATKGIKGATAGHIMNSLTKQIYNPNVDTDKVEFIPCFYQKLWVEWKDRQKGPGGIVKSHPDDRLLGNTRKNDKGQDVLPNGNILNTTAYFFGMVVVDGEPIRCVIGLTSTQLKKARQWLSMATSIKFDGPSGKFTPPLFAHSYYLSAIPENNDKGSWYGWKVEMCGRNEEMVLIEEARTIQQQSRAGAMKLMPADPSSEHSDAIPGQE
jgi:hypothetical protein